MKQLKITLIIAFFAIVGLNHTSAQYSQITPAPYSIERKDTDDMQLFDATQELNLYIDADSETTERIRAAIAAAGLKVKEVKKPAKKTYLNLAVDASAVKEAEGYHIATTPEGINIKAHSGAGLFYAIQSIRQMMEGELEGKWLEGEIYDYPRFEYRGILIDISRHLDRKSVV